MRALTFSRFGGPEVLVYREVPDPELPRPRLTALSTLRRGAGARFPGEPSEYRKGAAGALMTFRDKGMS